MFNSINLSFTRWYKKNSLLIIINFCFICKTLLFR